MMEAQNDAYSSAFIRKKRKTDYWEFNENYIPVKRYLKMDFNFSTSESSCCSTISSELLVSNPAILTKFNAHPLYHRSNAVLVSSYGRNCGRRFLYFLSDKILTNEAVQRKWITTITFIKRRNTWCCIIMKYQQDQMILRALMYCINHLIAKCPKMVRHTLKILQQLLQDF